MQRIKEIDAKDKGDLLVNSPSVYRHKTNKNTKKKKKKTIKSSGTKQTLAIPGVRPHSAEGSVPLLLHGACRLTSSPWGFQNYCFFEEEGNQKNLSV